MIPSQAPNQATASLGFKFQLDPLLELVSGSKEQRGNGDVIFNETLGKRLHK